MTTQTAWLLGWLVPLALGACAASQSQPQPASDKVTPQMRSGSTELRTYQVHDWIAPDDRTLLVNALDRSLFEGRFKGECAGLRLVDTIAFIFHGTPQVDTYAGIVLPDGTRCPFASFTRLAAPPARPRDTTSSGSP